MGKVKIKNLTNKDLVLGGCYLLPAEGEISIEKDSVDLSPYLKDNFIEVLPRKRLPTLKIKKSSNKDKMKKKESE